MKTYQCSKCGCCLQQPTEPFRCPQCGSQGIGLFQALPDGYGSAGGTQGGYGQTPGNGFSGNYGGGNYPQQPSGGFGNAGGFRPQQGFPQQPSGPFGQPSGGFGNATPNAPFGQPPRQNFGQPQNMPANGMPQNPSFGNPSPFGNNPPGGGFRPPQAPFGQSNPQQPMGNPPGNAGFGNSGGHFGAAPGGGIPGGGIRGTFPGGAINPRMPMGNSGISPSSMPGNMGGTAPMGNMPNGMNPGMGGNFGGMPSAPMNPPTTPSGASMPVNPGMNGGMTSGMAGNGYQGFAPAPGSMPNIPVSPSMPMSPQSTVPEPSSTMPPSYPAGPTHLPTPSAGMPSNPVPFPDTTGHLPEMPGKEAVPQAQNPPLTPPSAPSAPQQRPSAPQPRPAISPRPAPAQQRPMPKAPPRQNFPAPPTDEAEKPVKKTVLKKPGVHVMGKPVPKTTAGRPASANDPKARPRYRAPEPRPEIRPEIDRPERCFWGFPEEPPFTVNARPMRNTPVVDAKGRMILVSQGSLYALDISHPEPEVSWEYVIKSHVPGPIVVDANGDYHFHSADGYLHCVTPSGKQSWMPVQVGEPLGYAAPIVDAWGNTIISDYNGGLIRVSNEGRKDSRPYFRCRAKLDSSGVIAGDTLYIGSEEGYLFAIQLGDVSGRNLWDQGREVGYAGGFLNSSPAITKDGTIVVASRTEKLIGFHSNGEVAWTTHMPGQLLGSPVIDSHGHIYVGASLSTRQGGQGYLVSVDGTSHKIRWQYQAEEMIESTPVVGDDGTIYFGDNAGWVYALSPRGDKKWAVKYEAAVRSAGTIIAPNLLTYALDDDVLVGMRCESADLGGEWPKLGRDNFHSFVGPTPAKELSEEE